MGGSARVYLDWNASAPLRAEARAAMIDALDRLGNPSSQHAEGRAARALLEQAREQVAVLVGAEPQEVVFASGATEAANMAMAARPWGRVRLPEGEHAAVRAAAEAVSVMEEAVPVDASGAPDAARMAAPFDAAPALVVAAAAQGETGVALAPRAASGWAAAAQAWGFSDATQLAGKAARETGSGALRGYGFDTHLAAISAHKFGGPRGIGALLVREGLDVEPLLKGGGQELGRRSGTENLIGAAGMGAAAAAAARDLAAGRWEEVAFRRDNLAAGMLEAAQDSVEIGAGAPWRLANTVSVAMPGARAESLLIRLDLAGFAVSAGSACSSGKMTPSPVLAAMGLDPETAAAAIRVSIGPTTTDAEIDAFLAAWRALRQG